MSKISMTVKQIMELGLWDKVSEYLGIDSCKLMPINKVLEFDTEFKKPVKVLSNEFTSECFILRNNNGEFCYGKCSGKGIYFDEAEKWNNKEDVSRFINHNRKYDNVDWKIRRVKINFKIVGE